MGRASRQKRHYPKHLGEKLLQIRQALSLSQSGMLRRLGSPEGLLGTSISAYERAVREPPLLVLLEYARIAGICVDTLLDDKARLPVKLPGIPKHQEYKSSTTVQRRKSQMGEQ